MHITVANGKKLKIEAVGTVRLKLKDANVSFVVYVNTSSLTAMASARTWFPRQAESEALTAVLIAAMLSAVGVLTPGQTIIFIPKM